MGPGLYTQQAAQQSAQAPRRSLADIFIRRRGQAPARAIDALVFLQSLQAVLQQHDLALLVGDDTGEQLEQRFAVGGGRFRDRSRWLAGQ